MKIKLFTLISLLAFSLALIAQTTPEGPQLKASDVENFIKHFKSIQEEIDLEDFDANTDYQSMVEAMGGYSKINNIVSKYGYADYIDFATKTWAISTSYASIKMNSEGGGLSQVELALKEIEENDNMTAEQKQMAKQQIEMLMQSLGTTFTSNTSEQDIKTVKPYVSELDVIYEEE